MADETEELRDLERARLAAFVGKDMATLQKLHASDLQLINPGGQQLTREDYLNGVAAGFIEYKTWEPESDIEVRTYGEGAVLRYRAQVEIAVKGNVQPMQRFWETAVYEKRDGQWQVVWSQSTRIDL